MKNPYTKVPQWFFDVAPKLKPSELRCLIAIVRQTKGWNRESDHLSFTQLMDMTGLSQQGVANGLAGLKQKAIIDADGAAIKGQKITITPQNSEIIATISITTENELNGTQLFKTSTQLINYKVESNPEKVESKSDKVESQRIPTNDHIKESPTMQKLTPEQEESLAILVGVGLSEDISRQLIVKAWENGHDSEYINQVVGYVNSIAARNPPGMVRSLIEQNQGRIHTSKGQQGPEKPVKLDKYAHGGKEHKLVEASCPICHPSMVNRIEEEQL